MKKILAVVVLLFIIVVTFSFAILNGTGVKNISLTNLGLSFLGFQPVEDGTEGEVEQPSGTGVTVVTPSQGVPIPSLPVQPILGEELGGGIDTPLGDGCTTPFYIDDDCDNYGVGKQQGGQYNRFAVDIYGNMPDANDNDPAINTPQSVVQYYGDPVSNLQNLRNFLTQSRGYNSPDEIYFIALNGDDSTGQVNNINRPYRTFDRIREFVGANDFVIYRGGTYSSNFAILNLSFNYNYTPHGNPGNPLVIMAYPGENVIFDAYYSIGGTDGTRHIVFDGFVLTCNPGVCHASGFGQVGFNIVGSANDLTIRNIESLRHQWGIWGGIAKNGVVIEKSVIHHNNGEHGIYIPNADSMPDRPNGPMTNFVIRRNLIHSNLRHGLQLNGKMNGFIVEENIIHSNALGGISLINGTQNSIFRNNLIFNNNKQGIVLFAYCDGAYSNCESPNPGGCLVGLIPACPVSTTSCSLATYPQCYGNGEDFRQPNSNNQFINNLIWVGRDFNGVCEAYWGNNPSCNSSPSGFSAIDFLVSHSIPNHQNYTFSGNVFRNNIFNTNGAPVFRLDKLSHILSPGSLIENNLFFRNSGEPAGLASQTTDGSHTSTYNVVNAIYHAWSFSAFQNHWPGIVRNNILGNPNFMDVGLGYSTEVERFNFDPRVNSPSINIGLSTLNTPLTDIRGRVRSGLTDAGVYEYITGTAPAPSLNSITPNPIVYSANQNALLSFNGNNFESGATLQLCSASGCVTATGFNRINSQLIRLSFGSGRSAGIYDFRVRNPDGQTSLRLPLTVTGGGSTGGLQGTQGPGASTNFPGTGLQAPTAPSSLSVASLSTSQLRLTWSDNSTNETRFEIERRSGSSSFTSLTSASNLPANSNGYTDTGLSTNTVYEYRVRAANPAGVSPWSNVGEGRTANTPAQGGGGGGGGGGGSGGSSGGSAGGSNLGTVPISQMSISQLQELLASLRATLLALLQQRALGGGQLSSPVGSTTFTRDLEVGAVGEDVRSWQIYLNTHGFPIASSGPGSPGNESTYFGELTRVATARLQRSKGIVPALGYFGKLTRQILGL